METKKRWEICKNTINKIKGEGEGGQQMTASNIYSKWRRHIPIFPWSNVKRKKKWEKLMILNDNNGTDAKMKNQFEYQTKAHQNITERHINI